MRYPNENDIATAARAYHDGLGDPAGPLAIPTQRLAGDDVENPYVREQWEHLGRVDRPAVYSWDRKTMLARLDAAVGEVRRTRRVRTVGTLVELGVGFVLLALLLVLLVP